MVPVTDDLIRRFGWRNIGKIFARVEEFNISQIGKEFFKGDEKVQFYVFEENMGIELVAFAKTTERSLVRAIALNYAIEDEGSKFPTHLVCVRKERYKFNCDIYILRNDQIYQIQKEYRDVTKL